MSLSEFWQALCESVLLQRAVAAGIIASIACGVVGSYVVARRISYIAGGVAHCTLGGMGAAMYLQKVHHWAWCTPLLGAILSALLAALIIGWVSLRAREREDTVISALWALGMAIGVLFISQTPGYSEDLMGYLFGSILLVTHENLWMIVGLDLLVTVIGTLFYNRLLAVCFDEEFARLRGVHVEFWFLLLLCLTALTVVVLMTVVGMILVIALLTLPAAIAGQFMYRLWHVMVAASLISALLTASGLAISYGPDLPPGATTIALAGGLYLVVMGAKRLRRAAPA